MKKIYRKLALIIIGAVSTGMMSCEKFNEWEVEEGTNRLFRPSELVAAVDGVTATLSWKAKPNTSAYTVELSKDSLQFTQIVESYIVSPSKDADGYRFKIPDLLDPNTRYSARIKGVDTTGKTPESGWAVVTFVTKTEQIMYPVTEADITKNSVTLKWSVPNQVSHFMIGTVRHDITVSERLAGEKTITGLTPETSYTAMLYYNTSVRGSQSFKTNPDLPSGPDVVLVQPTDNLAAMISAATDGKMFVLLQGTKYTADNSINLPVGVGITIWGQPGPIKPILAFNGINLAATNKTIKFENLDITGYQNDAGLVKRNYLFNQSIPTITSGIEFQNCTIRDFGNTPMRIQASVPAGNIVVNNFIANNCIVHDIGNVNNYAFVHVNTSNPANPGSKIDNITITNSTFSMIGYGLILHSTSPSLSAVVENNTLYNAIGNTRYLIDYSTTQTVGTFIFRNNIIGKTLSPLNSARGIRYSGSNLIATNNYKTSDAVFSANLIPNIIEYNDTSASLFTGPDNGNFLIKDTGFAGKSDSGDPRWRR